LRFDGRYVAEPGKAAKWAALGAGGGRVVEPGKAAKWAALGAGGGRVVEAGKAVDSRPATAKAGSRKVKTLRRLLAKFGIVSEEANEPPS
jgi:hypothetical protein